MIKQQRCLNTSVAAKSTFLRRLLPEAGLSQTLCRYGDGSYPTHECCFVGCDTGRLMVGGQARLRLVRGGLDASAAVSSTAVRTVAPAIQMAMSETYPAHEHVEHVERRRAVASVLQRQRITLSSRQAMRGLKAAAPTQHQGHGQASVVHV